MALRYPYTEVNQRLREIKRKECGFGFKKNPLLQRAYKCGMVEALQTQKVCTADKKYMRESMAGIMHPLL